VPAEKQEPITALVDKILAARRANHRQDVTTLEASLDLKVRALYGITPASDVTTSSHGANGQGKTLVMEP
jgi:hypothetical protein